MRKTIIILMGLVLIASVLVACGGNNSTMEDTAKTFVSALIDRDEEALDSINRSDDMFGFPTDYLLTEIAPGFSNDSLSGFEFEVLEEKEIVTARIDRDGEEVEYHLVIQEIDGSYYFTDALPPNSTP